MTTVSINLLDVANFAPSQGDSVVFEAPTVRGAKSGAVISTAQHAVRLSNGVGSVQLEPGPVVVTINARNYRGQRQFRGVVPDSGSVSLLRVIEAEFEYEPAVMAEVSALLIQAQRAASGASESATAARSSQVAAKASETASKNSEVAAKASETAAGSSAAAAKVSEANAKKSEVAAKVSQDAAKASESNAKASETNANSSKDSADSSATAAAKSAASAKASETDAKDSADAAAASAASMNKATSATADSVVQRDGSGRAQVADPAAALDAVNKQYADKMYAAKAHTHLSADISDAATSAAAGKVVKWDGNSRFIVSEPTADGHPSTKRYVDTQVATRAAASHTHTSVQVSDATASIGTAATGNKVIKTNPNGKLSVPTASITDHTDVANKEYVDRATTGIASAGHKHTSADIIDSVEGGALKGSSADGGKLVRSDSNGRLTVQSANFDGVRDGVVNKEYTDQQDAMRLPLTAAYENSMVAWTSDWMPSNGATDLVFTDTTISMPKLNAEKAGQYSNRPLSKIFPYRVGRVYRLSVVANGSGEIELLFYRYLGSAYKSVYRVGNSKKQVNGRTTHWIDFYANSPNGEDSLAGAMYLVDKVTVESASIRDVTDVAPQYLSNTENLNDIVSAGLYHQSVSVNASGERNYPINLAGLLEVVNPTSSGMLYQRYTVYNDSGTVYMRSKHNNTWYPWRMLTAEGHSHTSNDVSDAASGYALTSAAGNGGRLVEISSNGTLEVHNDNLTRGNGNAVANKAYVDAQVSKAAVGNVEKPQTDGAGIGVEDTEAGQIPIRQSTGDIRVPIVPGGAAAAVSRGYVTVEMRNVRAQLAEANKVTSGTITPTGGRGELTWAKQGRIVTCTISRVANGTLTLPNDLLPLHEVKFAVTSTNDPAVATVGTLTTQGRVTFYTDLIDKFAQFTYITAK